MKLFILLTVTVFALCGCKKSTPVLSNTPTVAAGNADTIRYLALGDSYTTGEAIPITGSFPFQLINRLKGAGYSNAALPYIFAASGLKSSDLITIIAQDATKRTDYEFVTLLIGVNDQYQHVSLVDYGFNFERLLQAATNYARGDASRVFVLSIPDYSVTPFGLKMPAGARMEIEDFNRINFGLSMKYGVNYLNITELSREMGSSPELVSSDGLHPSSLMYQKWVNALLPIVMARLTKK